MKKKTKSQFYLSDCHNAPVYVASDGTKHYRCEECGNTCNPASKPCQKREKPAPAGKNLCIKCGKIATLGFSFDMDCTPIPTCEGCADDVREALLMMTLDVGSGGELAKNYTKKWHQPIIINHGKI